MLKEVTVKKKEVKLTEEPETSHLGYMTTSAVTNLLTEVVEYMNRNPDEYKLTIDAISSHLEGIVQNLNKEQVTNLAQAKDDGTLWTPADALVSALKDIKSKEGRTAFRDGKKILIIALDDLDDAYDISFIQAGMRLSECLSLCESIKMTFLRLMDLT